MFTNHPLYGNTTANDFDTMWLLLLLEIVVKSISFLCDWSWHWSMGEWFVHGLVVWPLSGKAMKKIQQQLKWSLRGLGLWCIAQLSTKMEPLK